MTTPTDFLPLGCPECGEDLTPDVYGVREPYAGEGAALAVCRKCACVRGCAGCGWTDGTPWNGELCDDCADAAKRGRARDAVDDCNYRASIGD